MELRGASEKSASGLMKEDTMSNLGEKGISTCPIASPNSTSGETMLMSGVDLLYRLHEYVRQLEKQHEFCHVEKLTLTSQLCSVKSENSKLSARILFLERRLAMLEAVLVSNSKNKPSSATASSVPLSDRNTLASMPSLSESADYIPSVYVPDSLSHYKDALLECLTKIKDLDIQMNIESHSYVVENEKAAYANVNTNEETALERSIASDIAADIMSETIKPVNRQPSLSVLVPTSSFDMNDDTKSFSLPKKLLKRPVSLQKSQDSANSPSESHNISSKVIFAPSQPKKPTLGANSINLTSFPSESSPLEFIQEVPDTSPTFASDSILEKDELIHQFSLDLSDRVEEMLPSPTKPSASKYIDVESTHMDLLSDSTNSMSEPSLLVLDKMQNDVSVSPFWEKYNQDMCPGHLIKPHQVELAHIASYAFYISISADSLILLWSVESFKGTQKSAPSLILRGHECAIHNLKLITESETCLEFVTQDIKNRFCHWRIPSSLLPSLLDRTPIIQSVRRSLLLKSAHATSFEDFLTK